jgi:hypothetical protein
MLRKAITVFLLMAVFFTLVLNTAAAPIPQDPVSNAFSTSNGPFVAAEPEALPALFFIGAAASFIGNAAYDYAKHKGWVWDLQMLPIQLTSPDVRAEAAFNF